jgi:hypothetical protein
MAAAPICISCNLERELISIRPVKNRHDMLQYECPGCRNVFRLVVERRDTEFDEVIFEEPALQAGAR